MLAIQGGILGGHKSAPVSHKHMLSHPSFSSPLINEDLLAWPQLVFTLNYRFFRHQACYSLLPAKPGGQADRVVSLCKYKVVGTARFLDGARIFKLLRRPRFDSNESIPPAFVARRAGTTTLFLLGS
jgi:hypothetical protein